MNKSEDETVKNSGEKPKFDLKKVVLIVGTLILLLCAISIGVYKENIVEKYNKVFHKPDATITVEDIRTHEGLPSTVEMEILDKESDLEKGTDNIYVSYNFESNVMSISGDVMYEYRYDFLNEEWYFEDKEEQDNFECDYDIVDTWEGTTESGNYFTIDIEEMDDNFGYSGTVYGDWISDDEITVDGAFFYLEEGSHEISISGRRNGNSWNRFSEVGFQLSFTEDYIEIPFDTDKEYILFDGIELTRVSNVIFLN